MTRVKLDGFTLEKRWHGRVLQEIKEHKPVEVWKRDVRHHDSDPEVLVYHPIMMGLAKDLHDAFGLPVVLGALSSRARRRRG